MITVFYDGKCGLCSREINHYKKIAPQGIFNWQDVTQTTHRLNQSGIKLSDALKNLHCETADKKIYIGVDAFIVIWQQLKGWVYLSQLVSLPFIYQLVKIGYKIFAQWRFNQLSHCQVTLEQDDIPNDCGSRKNRC